MRQGPKKQNQTPWIFLDVYNITVARFLIFQDRYSADRAKLIHRNAYSQGGVEVN